MSPNLPQNLPTHADANAIHDHAHYTHVQRSNRLCHNLQRVFQIGETVKAMINQDRHAHQPRGSVPQGYDLHSCEAGAETNAGQEHVTLWTCERRSLLAFSDTGSPKWPRNALKERAGVGEMGADGWAQKRNGYSTEHRRCT